MVRVQHYDLLGLYPQIENFDLEAGLKRWNEIKDGGYPGEQFTLGTKLVCAAAHFFGLSQSDYRDLNELVVAMEAMNTELAVR